MTMQDALKRELGDQKLLFRERVILAWVRVLDRPTTVREICQCVGLSLTPTQITMKSLYERGYIKRVKQGDTFVYSVH